MHDPARFAPSRVLALAWWAPGVMALALVLRGSVAPADQALLHVLVAVGAAIAATLPAQVLGVVGAGRAWVLGGALILATLALGLLPMPSAALAIVSPGLVAARPADAVHTLSFDPEATISEIGTMSLALGFGLVVGVWGAIRRRRHVFERAVLAGVGALVVVGLAHRALALESVFGVIGTTGDRQVLFGPLVNENHMGTLVLLGLPVATAQLFEHEARRDMQWALSLFVLVAGLALLVAIGSPGVVASGVVVAALAYLSGRGGRWDAWMGVLIACGLTGTAVVGVVAHESFFGDSVAPRGLQWRATVRLFADHWLAGVGGGSYGAAFPPYRTDGVFRHMTHAHSDPLEWLAETGVLGVASAIGVLALWWPRAAEREPSRARAIDLGLLGVAVHALVDFPLQIPAVAMAVGAVLAGRATIFVPRRAAPPWAVRGLLIAVAACQVAFAAWQVRAYHVHAAVAQAREAPGPATLAAADAALSRWAPWRAEAGVVQAWRAEAAGEAEGALLAARAVIADHPEDADALRQAALVLVRGRRLDEARLALERAALRAPRDQRTWVALGRVRKALGDVEGAVSAFDEALSCARPGENVRIEEAYWLRPDPAFWVGALADSASDWSSGLANLALRTGKPEGALAALEQAGSIDPVYLDDLRVAEALLASGREADAEAWLRERAVRLPKDAQGWVALGGVLDGLGRPQEAEEAFLQAVELRPSDMGARVLAIRSAESGEGPAEALKLLRRFEAMGHSDPRLSLEAARLLLERGEPGSCIGEIESSGLREHAEIGAEARALFARCGAQNPG